MRTEFVYGRGVSPTIGQDRLPWWGQSTIRMTPNEKMIAQQLVEEIQALTHKNITVSTLLRAGLYLAQTAGPEKVLKAIKENI